MNPPPELGTAVDKSKVSDGKAIFVVTIFRKQQKEKQFCCILKREYLYPLKTWNHGKKFEDFVTEESLKLFIEMNL